eukprot:9049865-Lingulodinium_polyedra.AAC.1
MQQRADAAANAQTQRGGRRAKHGWGAIARPASSPCQGSASLASDTSSQTWRACTTRPKRSNLSQ